MFIRSSQRNYNLFARTIKAEISQVHPLKFRNFSCILFLSLLLVRFGHWTGRSSCSHLRYSLRRCRSSRGYRPRLRLRQPGKCTNVINQNAREAIERRL
jgi:hypothetical protein